jgi:hypothetical protein
VVVTIGLSPTSEKYDADDERWRDQVADLVADLRAETDAVSREWTPVPGTKGGIDELVLALGSAGVFTTAVEVLRAWLSRDQTRAVELSYTDRDGHEQRLSVTATHADDSALAPVIAAVAQQIQATT